MLRPFRLLVPVRGISTPAPISAKGIHSMDTLPPRTDPGLPYGVTIRYGIRHLARVSLVVTPFLVPQG